MLGGNARRPKLVIQIPCYNEAQTLPLVLAALPRQLSGVGQVELLVVDDGSTDGTAETARACGADHVVRHPQRRGLAAAFMTGVREALARGVDILVNTDGDGQYDGADLQRLIEPILRGEAALVIGERPIESLPHFSWFKKKLQRLGSALLRWLSELPVRDAASGYRAYTRDFLLRLNLYTPFSHTLETLLYAAAHGYAVRTVPVRAHAPTRPSRLFRSTFGYLLRSFLTLLQSLAIYRPWCLFGPSAAICWLLAAGCLGQAFSGALPPETTEPKLWWMAAAVAGCTGLLLCLLGLLAETTAAARKATEEALALLRMGGRRRKTRVSGGGRRRPGPSASSRSHYKPVFPRTP